MDPEWTILNSLAKQSNLGPITRHYCRPTVVKYYRKYSLKRTSQLSAITCKQVPITLFYKIRIFIESLNVECLNAWKVMKVVLRSSTTNRISVKNQILTGSDCSGSTCSNSNNAYFRS